MQGFAWQPVVSRGSGPPRCGFAERTRGVSSDPGRDSPTAAACYFVNAAENSIGAVA